MTVLALLGTGAMGAGMARNLCAAGMDVRLWNRTAATAQLLAAELGAQVAPSPAAAVAGADAVITMLWDARSVADVMASAAGGLAVGTLWVQMSTVGVDGAAQLGRLAAQHGLVYVDAPVLGTRKPAEDGALVILASGPDEAHAPCAEIFEAIGRRTLWVGPAGAGSRLKLVANAWVLSLVEAMAECMRLAGALDLDPALLLDAVQGGLMDTPYLQLKGAAVLSGDYTPTFTVAGGAKDAALIMEAARAAGAELGVLERVEEHFAAAVEAGYADLDLAATYLAHLPPGG